MCTTSFFFEIYKKDGSIGLYRLDHSESRVINFTMARELPGSGPDHIHLKEASFLNVTHNGKTT